MHILQGAGIKRVAVSTEVHPSRPFGRRLRDGRCWADVPMDREINRGPDQRNPTTREETPALPDV